MSESDRTIESEVMPVIVRANSIAIRTAEDYVSASEFLKAIKAAQKRVSDHFEPMKQAAHAAWKKITSTESDVMKPLCDSERVVKTRMMEWKSEQDRIRQEEQARLQAEADERARKEREALS